MEREIGVECVVERWRGVCDAGMAERTILVGEKGGAARTSSETCLFWAELKTDGRGLPSERLDKMR